MTPFSAAQRAALQSLTAAFPDAPAVLIGASALRLHLPDMRGTDDLDLTVALSLDELSVKLAGTAGWRRDAKHEHRWYGPGDTRVDLIPAGAQALRDGQLVWPASGARMTLTGFRHVFTHQQAHPLLAGGPVAVATLPVLVLLKMVAYQDRPAERERDLGDIGLVLDRYLLPDDDRRWSDDVLDSGVTFDETSSFVLGRELGQLLDARERTSVDGFLLACATPDARGTQDRMLRQGPASWARDAEKMASVLAALRAGLDWKR